MRLWSRLLPPLIICGVLAIFAGQTTWDHFQQFWSNTEARGRILQSVFLLALAWLFARLVLVLMQAVETEAKRTPLLLKNMIVVGIFAVAILWILAWVYEFPPTNLLATSGVAGVMMPFTPSSR